MTPQHDVVVIGGGVIGVCVAYYLRKAGLIVTLLERDTVCSGSSYGNSGLLVPSHSIPLPMPGVVRQALRWMLDPDSPFYVKPRLDPKLISWLWRFRGNCTPDRMRAALRTLLTLSRASRDLYDDLIAQEELDCNFHTDGMFMLYDTARGYEEGVEEGRMMQEEGLRMEEMTAAEVHGMEPSVRADIGGGVYYPGDAHLSPAEFVNGLAARVRSLGVAVHEGAEVVGFEARNGAIGTVRTTRGDYHPAQVVLAAGSWSPGLVRGLRLNLPVQPAKGYSVTFRREGPPLKYPLILGEARVGVNPMGSMMRLAGTLEMAGLDLSISERRVRAIVRGAARYLEGGDSFATENAWAGLRPVTPDGVPAIGRVDSYRNLIIATGHATLGMTLGPITGKLVSEIACDQLPSVDMAPVSPARFQ